MSADVDPRHPPRSPQRDPRRQQWPARRAAIIALALMLGYFAIDNHVPLYPGTI
jgi:hypothetical protein